jgi:O-antigen/teichoic acid export membrane protein
MRGMAHQAVVLSVSRIANYGLMIVSPIILVRFLTVADFGRYREFLLYASLLQTAAGFAIGESLLYFIPLHPASLWRVVRQTMILTAVVSSCVVGAFVVVDLLVPGGLVGPYLVPVALYVSLFVNVDCWENLWLATRRPVPVFAYTAARLLARLLVVVCVAVVTNDVTAIIWSLVVLEALRFAGSLIAWNRADRSHFEPPIEGMSRQQLRFCLPFGLATVLSMVSRNLGSVVIAKYLGVAALAQLTIGTYGEPIILALRNSISAVVLPELVRRGERSQDDALRLWHRTVVINCLLLFPTAAIVAWYAEPLIVKAFGASYRPAIPVLQWYALIIVRACFDFSPLLRAINKTRPFMTVGVVAALANGLTLLVLLPVAGIVGAAVGLAVSAFVEALYLGFSVSRLYGCGVRRLLPWTPVAKVAMCAAGGAVIAFGITFESRATLLGAVCGSLLYGAVFVVLLKATRVEEASDLLRRLRSLAPALRGPSQ